MRANLAIVDLGNGTINETPQVLATRVYPSSFGQFDAFASITTASLFSTGVGWFFYAQEENRSSGVSNPCKTIYIGQTHANLGLDANWIDRDLDTATPFPTLFKGGADYVGIIKRGLPGGDLFPTWHRAALSSGACATCNAATPPGPYALGIFGVNVTP